MTESNATGIGTAQTQLSRVLMLASKVRGVDIELALSRVSGKQQVMETFIEQLVYSTDEKIRRMSSCLEAGDLRDFSIEAHGLKATLAGVGATAYSEAASELEAHAKAGDVQSCADKFTAFAECVGELSGQLRRALPEHDAVEKPVGDKALLAHYIKDVSEYLKNFEADDALETMCRLQEYTFGEETDALLDYIRNKIFTFKYEEASVLVNSILG